LTPFDSLTVVSVEQAVAAPLATRQLADLGARVVKIERPGVGDFARAYDTTVKGLSSYFVWLNRSKQSLTLDLKRPAGQAILERLLARADVFVQNVAPGASARLGTDPAMLRARHPALVVCTISGYGSSGPFADRKAYDLLVQAEAGLVSLTGSPDEPAKAGIAVADIAAGMHAHAGILAALLARASHGRGAAVEVSLFDALAEWMSAPAYYTAYGGSAPARTGPHHASIAPYGPVPTAGGETVCIGVQNDAEWTRLCMDVLARPDLLQDERFRSTPARAAHRDALAKTIADATGRLVAADLVARLDGAGIAHARMNSMAEVLAHPQLSARSRWREIDSPAGPLRALRPPVEIDDAEAVMGAVPALGAHTDAILRELGYSQDQIEAWRTEGVI